MQTLYIVGISPESERTFAPLTPKYKFDNKVYEEHEVVDKIFAVWDTESIDAGLDPSADILVTVINGTSLDSHTAEYIVTEVKKYEEGEQSISILPSKSFIRNSKQNDCVTDPILQKLDDATSSFFLTPTYLVTNKEIIKLSSIIFVGKPHTSTALALTVLVEGYQQEINLNFVTWREMERIFTKIKEELSKIAIVITDKE